MNNKPILPQEYFSPNSEAPVFTLVNPPHRIGSESCSSSSDLTNNSTAFINKLITALPESAVDVQGNVAWWPNYSVLEELARDPNTPAVLLEQLTWHPVPDVRASVADNQNTPHDCILALAKDGDPHVRYQLAENHRLCLSVLTTLADDDHPYVAWRAQRTIARLQPN